MTARSKLTAIAALGAALLAAAPDAKAGPAQSDRFFQSGVASYYGGSFHGRRTSSGEVFDQRQLTAAHRTLPMGTLLLVTSNDTGRQVVVKVNDRGPFVRGRILDLSRGAAQQLGSVGRGVAHVNIQTVDGSQPIEVAAAPADDEPVSAPRRGRPHKRPAS